MIKPFNQVWTVSFLRRILRLYKQDTSSEFLCVAVPEFKPVWQLYELKIQQLCSAFIRKGLIANHKEIKFRRVPTVLFSYIGKHPYDKSALRNWRIQFLQYEIKRLTAINNRKKINSFWTYETVKKILEEFLYNKNNSHLCRASFSFRFVWKNHMNLIHDLAQDFLTRKKIKTFKTQKGSYLLFQEKDAVHYVLDADERKIRIQFLRSELHRLRKAKKKKV